MNFIQNLDISILKFIQQHMTNSFLDKVMPFISTLGNLGLVWIVISSALLINKKYRKIGVLSISSLLLTTFIGEGLLKNIIQRGRPFSIVEGIKLIVKAPRTFSFPSGHTASSFAVATVIAKEIKKIKMPVYILAFLIAFSRLYLYVHYPSDILAGALLGILCANIVLYIYNKRKA